MSTVLWITILFCTISVVVSEYPERYERNHSEHISARRLEKHRYEANRAHHRGYRGENIEGNDQFERHYYDQKRYHYKKDSRPQEHETEHDKRGHRRNRPRNVSKKKSYDSHHRQKTDEYEDRHKIFMNDRLHEKSFYRGQYHRNNKVHDMRERYEPYVSPDYGHRHPRHQNKRAYSEPKMNEQDSYNPHDHKHGKDVKSHQPRKERKKYYRREHGGYFYKSEKIKPYQEEFIPGKPYKGKSNSDRQLKGYEAAYARQKYQTATHF